VENSQGGRGRRGRFLGQGFMVKGEWRAWKIEGDGDRGRRPGVHQIVNH